jgi:hypothetical protein
MRNLRDRSARRPDFSAADAYLFAVTRWAPFVDLDLSRLANLTAFMDTIATRAASRSDEGRRAHSCQTGCVKNGACPAKNEAGRVDGTETASSSILSCGKKAPLRLTHRQPPGVFAIDLPFARRQPSARRSPAGLPTIEGLRQ